MRKKDKDKYFPIYREIGRRVAFYRNLRGLSQEELAAKVDISTSHLAKIEGPNTNTSFSLDILLVIADGLDIDVAAFFNPPDLFIPFMKNKKVDTRE
ncbi:MAG TPA: helix-turn-helix transcriptional regulator [Selenomonadales bacterium]|nr:helix-turn-helix transcriptional regulator [Selenomonadales bacterium]